MSVYDRLQSAFEERLAGFQHLPAGGVEWPNVALDAPEAGEAWVRCRFTPSAASRRGLGEGGHSRIDGLFTMWLNWPRGVGTSESAIVADRLVKLFKSGTRVESGGEYATCLSALNQGGGVEGAWWVTPIVVSWYAHTTKV